MFSISHKQIPWVTAIGTGISVVLFALVGPMESLAFHRGEFSLFTPFTCHMVHWSGEHLFYDALMFLGLGIWCESIHKKNYYLFLVVASILIPIGATWFTPHIDSYAGFSGLTMGQAAFGVSTLAYRVCKEGRILHAVLLSLMGICTIAKLLWEFIEGGNLFVNNPQALFVPVPVAHLIGVSAGLLFGIYFAQKNRIHPLFI